MKKFSISYYPSVTGANTYSLRFKHILAMYGDVQSFSFRDQLSRIVKSPLKRYDYLFVNWLDSDLLDLDGKLNSINIIKVIFKLILFRARSKKVIYVKHNVYPHATAPNSIKSTKKCIKLIEFFCDHVIVHSLPEASSSVHYVPHPLYMSTLPKFAMPETCLKDTFIVFGRITKYKRLEELIDSFPENKNLIIAGCCEDEDYLKYLETIAPGNISFVSKYLTDDEAKNLIDNTQGIIINHADADMIVSGSFFYAMSIGIRVICVKTEFLRWSEAQFGDTAVKCYSDIFALCSGLTDVPLRERFDDSLRNKIISNFGDDIIYKKLRDIIDL
ncbi:hypothetical protein [Serratia fonticola]|uniref:hypothetical protein n=1 Tax=Serratia fonticola TaxID=47917 RepID=UPI00192B849E|nr:hypothetical protein [Serratia fonticola]MBL5824659.1 hypothetical protein [Serratia fonticola]